MPTCRAERLVKRSFNINIKGITPFIAALMGAIGKYRSKRVPTFNNMSIPAYNFSGYSNPNKKTPIGGNKV
jgi:hypothetical protein